MTKNPTGIILCADEIRERSIQETEWADDPPRDSLGEMLRMQEIVRFNYQMTRRYGHLRKVPTDV
jgi:hypothetical protein